MSTDCLCQARLYVWVIVLIDNLDETHYITYAIGHMP